MKVNLQKSKILIFRKGGRIKKNEKWTFNNNPIEIVQTYIYLGVKFTPKMYFTEHIQERNNKAKICANSTWNQLLSDNDVEFKVKVAIFESVVRSIQLFFAQDFGFDYADIINKFQQYFLKLILKVPDFTPNYALYVETKELPSRLYALTLHMKYIFKSIFIYEEDRLPNVLSKKIIDRKIYWFKNWCDNVDNTLAGYTFGKRKM